MISDILSFVTSMLLPIFAAMIILVFALMVLVFFKAFVDKRVTQYENKEINNNVDKAIERLMNAQNSDVLDLMLKNVAELREYYVISKRQATSSFTSALIISFLGFIIYASGICVTYFGNVNVMVFTTIAGSVVQVVSGLFFWLYKQSLVQLNIYHERLGTTEKYLIAMQLIEKMCCENKDESYRYLIEAMLRDNYSVVNTG